MMLNTENLIKLKNLLEQAENIAITSHFPPDHDSISSVLLLRNLLMKLYPNKIYDCISKASMDGKFSEFEFIDSKSFIPADTMDLRTYDLIILVDVEDLERAIKIENTGLDLNELKSKTIVLDHHDIQPDSRNLLSIIDSSYASSTHLIVRLFQKLFPELVIDEQSSSLAQLGIIADTNRFLYSTNNDLYSLMADLSRIKELDYEVISEHVNKLHINSLLIVETLLHNLIVNNHCAYTYYNTDVYDDDYVTEKEIKEGCSIFLQSISKNLVGIDLVCLLKPFRNDNLWRVQMRSRKNTVNVSNLAKKFKGGGHINASSCVIKGISPLEIIEQIEAKL